MVRICVPFKIEHAKYIVEKENKRDQEAWVEPPIVDNWCKQWEGKLWAYTVLVDGEPVACGGLALMEWQKAEAWAVFSSDFKKHILFIYKIIKLGLKASFHELNLRRIQTTIDPQYPENITWIEKLGFEYEGRLRKYGNAGQDMLIYSRLQ